MKEWKEVKDFTRYKVSPVGEVWDTKSDRQIAQMLTGIPQYYYVNLYRDDGKRKLVRVHRLVAEAYCHNSEPDSFNMVDHIDRNKLNNHKDNLRWVDRKGNAGNQHNNVIYKGGLLRDYC